MLHLALELVVELEERGGLLVRDKSRALLHENSAL